MGDGSAGGEVLVPLEALDPGDLRYRFRTRLEVGELAADIARNGQDFPVVVRPRGSGLQLVCGFRRVAALRSLGAVAVRAVVRELDDDEALRLAWSENESREDYSDLDRAHAMLKAQREGKSWKELEALFGLKSAQIGRLRALAEVPEVVREALEAGRITTTHAVVLNQMARRYPELEHGRWVGEIVERGLSVRQLRQRIGLAYEAPARPLVVFEEDGGGLRIGSRRLVPAKMSAEERESTIEALEQALALLREES